MPRNHAIVIESIALGLGFTENAHCIRKMISKLVLCVVDPTGRGQAVKIQLCALLSQIQPPHLVQRRATRRAIAIRRRRRLHWLHQHAAVLRGRLNYGLPCWLGDQRLDRYLQTNGIVESGSFRHKNVVAQMSHGSIAASQDGTSRSAAA